MRQARELSTLGNCAAEHDGLLAVVFQSSDLVAGDPLACSQVALAATANGDACFAQGAVVALRVHCVTCTNAVAIAVDAVVPQVVPAVVGNGVGALVLLRVPVAVAEVICVTADPGVYSFGRRLVFLAIPEGALLVVAVERDGRRVRQLATLRMVLDDFPVFCY
uniref:Uncharacterized protein n=1 Tax=Favella ehrenbergii TaxID=182087 RepID=A0A7S3MJP7_9SPIT